MPPSGFDKCQADGGKVRRKTLPGDKYINICYKGGESYAGYVKKKKGKK